MFGSALLLWRLYASFICKPALQKTHSKVSAHPNFFLTLLKETTQIA